MSAATDGSRSGTTTLPGYRVTALIAASLSLGAAPSVDALRCEQLVNPQGIDVAQPRLSWTLQSRQRGVKQTAYQILVATSEAGLKSGRPDLWDSGKVSSDESVLVPYGGQPLKARTPCFWKVRVWDGGGKPGDWSPPAQWTMGLLAAIPADEIGESHQAGLLFRLGTEWFLLEAANTVEVTEPRLIRRIPRRTNSLFLGMVNIRGELKLAFDLRELLGITPNTREPIENQRLIVSRMEGQTWVFPAPEVKGILHYLPSMQTGVPTTIERWKSSFISSIVTWEQKKVGVLDSGGILGRLGKHLR